MHDPIRAHIKALRELAKSALKKYHPDSNKLTKVSRTLLRGLPHCTARSDGAKWINQIFSLVTMLAQLR